MDEDQLMKEVLDKFVNCHEQTYEEFVSTFTHLSKEIDVSKGRAHGTNSSANIFTSVKISPKSESNGHHIRNAAAVLQTSSQCSEEDEVNSFLDLEDLDMDEESKPQASTDVLLLPGEAEQDLSTSVPAWAPRVQQPPTSEVKPKPTVEKTQKKHTEEILGDEVQPFCLDEEFDYDNVALTPKFTFEEIETIKKLSEQKIKDANLD